jgi:hypothetical protein
MKKYFKFATYILIVFFAMSTFLFSTKALAGTGDNVTGWAWGETEMPNGTAGGMGWLSFNCTNAASGGCSHIDDSMQTISTKYGVNVDMTTGYMTGTAWSENYGWVKFDAGCPSGTSGDCSARLNFTTNKLMGFARVLSGSDIPGQWDGWISLNAANDQDATLIGMQPSTFTYGISYDPTTGALTGFAWGFEVTGWVKFINVFTLPQTTDDLALIPTATPATDLQGLPKVITIPTGNNVYLNWWSPTGTVFDHCVATATQAVPLWTTLDFTASSTNLVPLHQTPANSTVFGSVSNVPVPVTGTKYTLSCYKTPTAPKASVANATVNTSPTITPNLFLHIKNSTATSGTAFPPTYLIDLQFDSSNPDYSATTSCVGLGGGTDWNTNLGTLTSSNSYSISKLGVSVPTNPTNFQVKCLANNGSWITSNTVIVSKYTATCQDPTATNYGGPLPCTYGQNPTTGGNGGGVVPIYNEPRNY